jgi:PAS domain S-box-containing protein
MKRRLQTGHPDDVQFDVTRTYRFGIAVMDNAGGFEAYGKGHSFDLGAKTLEFGGLGSEEVTQLVLIKDYLTSAKAHIRRGEAGLAISSINDALAIYDAIGDKAADIDPSLYIAIKNGFVTVKRNPTITHLDELKEEIDSLMLTFQGKRKPKEASWDLKFIIAWGKIQIYVFILLALVTLFPIVASIKVGKRPEFRHLSLFLFIVTVPIVLEGIGRIGMLTNVKILQNFSFMTNEYATFIWAMLMVMALFVAKAGFGDVNRTIRKLERHGLELEQKVEERTREIQETKDYLKSIISSVNDGIMIMDREYSIVDANPTALEMAKLDRDKVIGNKCYKVNHHEEKPCNSQLCPLKEVFKTGKPVNVTHTHYTSDGQPYIVDISASPIKDEEGKVTHMVEVARDITEKAKLEQQIIESEKKYRNLVETMNEGLLLIDSRGDITFSNKRFASMFNYQIDELLGRNIYTLFDGENKKKLKAELSKSEGLSIFELEINTKDGKKVPILISTAPLTDGGRIAAITDLTEIKRLEKIVLQSEKLAATGKLAASVAHEINNPLFGIKNVIYILMDEIKEDDPNRKYLEMADEELDRIANIVGQLLDFHRPSMGKMVPVNVNTLIKDVLTLVGNQLKNNNIKVTTKFNPKIPNILASSEQLKQVFLNIILNAQEAMPNGGELSVHTDVEDDHIRIDFTDTGKGIPPEDIEHIFDPFFTTKKRKGSGLGLSICHGIIRSHNGRIEVESEVGKGTTFTIILPIK